MKRKTIVLIGAAVVVLAVLFGLKEYFRTNADLSGETPVAELPAPALIRAFETDPAKSNQRYLDKVVAVEGRIRSIRAESNPVVVSLGEEGQMSSVQCSMDSTHAGGYDDLSKGQPVRVKGLCTGALTDELLGTDVKLTRCIIETKN